MASENIKTTLMPPRKRARQFTKCGKPLSDYAVLEFLSEDRAAGAIETAAALGLPYQTVFWCLRRLVRDGMVQLAGAVLNSNGRTVHMYTATKNELPLLAMPTKEIVRKAIRNRHPIDIAWLGAGATGANP